MITDDMIEPAFNMLNLFGTVDEQTEYYKSAFDGFKDAKKTMRKYIQQKNKPPKAARKPRAPKDENAEPKEKKPRAKKTVRVSDDTKNDLIGQLVAAATTPDVIPAVVAPASDNVVSSDAETKEKKPRKPRAKKADAVAEAPAQAPAQVDAAPVAAEPKQTKPKAKKEKKVAEQAQAPAEATTTEDSKPKAKGRPAKKAQVQAQAPAPVPVTTQELAEEDDDDEEIQTREMILNGKQYLVDGDNNVYDYSTHDQIGTYNADTKSIVA